MKIEDIAWKIEDRGFKYANENNLSPSEMLLANIIYKEGPISKSFQSWAFKEVSDNDPPDTRYRWRVGYGIIIHYLHIYQSYKYFVRKRKKT